MKKRVNYDDLADEYDHRYAGEQRSGTGEALLPLARAIRPARVLEVGCGTGHWREELAGFVPGCIGLDFSLGMLARGGPSWTTLSSRRRVAPNWRCWTTKLTRPASVA